MFENIKQKLSLNAEKLESALSSYYDYTDSDYAELIESQRYSLLGGGKRIRAFLTVEFCKLFGGDERAAIPYACAIEMVHAYSLVHDDLPCMDNDDMRRGKPSNHKVYGETVALLAGDALLTRAFSTAVSNPECDSLKNAKAVELLAKAAGGDGMIGGQTIDIKAAKEKIDFDTLLRLHKLKTGKMICASAMLGCVAAGIFEDDERFKRAKAYAERVGLAFQIVDDILEYENGEHENNSFLSFMSVEEAKKYARDISNEACENIKKYDSDNTFGELAEYLTIREY